MQRRMSLALVACVIFSVFAACPAWAEVIYVNASATGANNGTDWTDAYTDLQSALAAARSSDEIWVAAGTYKPTTGTDRTISFAMKGGVALYGGLMGTEDPATFDLADRNFEASETVLNGDLLDDDNENVAHYEPNRQDNSYHVVMGTNHATLDGFTVTAGNANGSRPHYFGGGMFNYYSSSPTVTNCTFISNSAIGGGGMANYSGSPIVTNCTFSGNSAAFGQGGGMANYLSNPMVTGCTFSGNSALHGAGMVNSRSSPTVTNCTFTWNVANYGSGISSDYSSPTVTNCTFSANTANGGGGMRNSSSNPTVTNCTFSGNSATDNGGGIYNDGLDPSNPTLVNCILWDNTASGGGPQIHNSFSSTPTVTYSDVQGGWPGTGNINADPLFVDAAGGDYHLQSGSPCIDAGAFIASFTDDFEGDPRGYDGTAEPRGDGSDHDIGADEFWPSANAGQDFFGYEGRGAATYICGLDGTGSTGVSTRLWEQIAGVTVILRNAETLTPDFDAPQWDGSIELTKTEACLRFRLTINAGEADEDADECEVDIRIPGDATGDDTVNAFDLAKLRQADPTANFNGDEFVNAFDLAILRQNSGRARTVE